MKKLMLLGVMVAGLAFLGTANIAEAGHGYSRCCPGGYSYGDYGYPRRGYYGRRHYRYYDHGYHHGYYRPYRYGYYGGYGDYGSGFHYRGRNFGFGIHF